jgi:hypothetical protein
MKMTIGDLRKTIREVLSEVGGAKSTPSRPTVNNPMSPSMADREQIGRVSVKDSEDPEEITDHLRDPLYDEEECWGPVPPTSQNPYALPDYFTKDFGVLPTGNIKR